MNADTRFKSQITRPSTRRGFQKLRVALRRSRFSRVWCGTMRAPPTRLGERKSAIWCPNRKQQKNGSQGARSKGGSGRWHPMAKARKEQLRQRSDSLRQEKNKGDIRGSGQTHNQLHVRRNVWPEQGPNWRGVEQDVHGTA